MEQQAPHTLKCIATYVRPRVARLHAYHIAWTRTTKGIYEHPAIISTSSGRTDTAGRMSFSKTPEWNWLLRYITFLKSVFSYNTI